VAAVVDAVRDLLGSAPSVKVAAPPTEVVPVDHLLTKDVVPAAPKLERVGRAPRVVAPDHDVALVVDSPDAVVRVNRVNPRALTDKVERAVPRESRLSNALSNAKDSTNAARQARWRKAHPKKHAEVQKARWGRRRATTSRVAP
jgi:hypothetical protein